ncbi:MAG: Response regulator receiver protein [Bacteriovoracaceae bacterium]|nr:Response regulator receiver protein [Bacteriovoracaceae bacterium]
MSENSRILIVDDNREIHNDFKKILESKANENGENLGKLEEKLFGASAKSAPVYSPSFHLDSAFQGQEALEMVEKAAQEGKPYALLFVDVRMPPGWDGVETVKQIWKKYPDIEVVICTAYSDYSSEDILKELSLTHRLLILKKPFDSIAVKQMALTLTRKWGLEEESRNQLKLLEAAVNERTQELRESHAELEKSLKKLSETQSLLMTTGKMSALGEMAGGIAHEINNPLAIIQLRASQLSELIQEPTVDKTLALELIEKIETTSTRIAKIIRGLRLFSRDKSSDPFEVAALRTIMDDTLDFCREKFSSHGIELKIDDVSHQIKFECRATQISQVILNLLNNAFDVMNDLPEKWVKIGVIDSDDKVEISVEDSGKGIPEDLRQRIFEPFFTTKDVNKGTGLGLSVSKGLIESHNGVLCIDANCSHTRFLISLPKIQKDRKSI